MRKVDIIVLGAGISGCIAAALLARKGYRVVIISRDAGTAHHLPESWIYNLPPSIRNLGIEERILPALCKQSRCVFCSSNHQCSVEFSIKDISEIQLGDIVCVDRSQFDSVLLDAALEQGAVLQPFSSILSCEISDSEVILNCESQNEKHAFRAPYILDATGKTAFLSQHLNLPMDEKKLDSRVAYFSHFELQSEMPDGMRIVSIKGGYLFCIPLSKKRLSIGCVIAENLTPPNVPLDEIFASATSSSPYIVNLIDRSTRVLPIIPAKNSRRICLEPAGLRYRLLGDAAAFLDPFFCPGIDFAFFSAEQAVETIESNTPQNYKTAVQKWLENSTSSTYEKIEHLEWQEIIRLFADPHLPFVVPLMLTQAFCKPKKGNLPFEEGIQLARRAYEVAAC